jgi:hypothetical protein
MIIETTGTRMISTSEAMNILDSLPGSINKDFKGMNCAPANINPRNRPTSVKAIKPTKEKKMIFMKIIKPFRHPDLCGAEEEESRADDADDAVDTEFAEGVDEAAGGAGGIPSGVISSSLLFASAAT